MIRKFFYCVIAVTPILCSAVASAEVNSCAALFESSVYSVNDTIENLAELKINLDIAKAQGKSSIELTALTGAFKKKATELFKYVRKNDLMTNDQFRDRLKLEIAKKQNLLLVEKKQTDELKKEETNKRKAQIKKFDETAVDGLRAIMHKIEPGSFKMGEPGKKVDVTITKPFELSATPTTQILWRTVVNLAEAKFPGKYKLDPDPVFPSTDMIGDTQPVQEVSHNDVHVWLKALNELSQIGEPSLTDLIPSHKQGDIYRLPTEAEWEFVMRGRGIYNDEYHFGNDESELKKHAWYKANSEQKSHPVALLEPLVVDGNTFYDMHGNVWEWVEDWYQENLSGGIDPKGPDAGTHHVVRGGGWFHQAPDQRSSSRDKWVPGYRFGATGFRLARTDRAESAKLNAQQQDIDNTIKNLAELKINLDTAKAQGLSSIELTALANNFKSKSFEFYKYVRKNNLMTKDQYLERMKEEISKIQIQQKENDLAKKEIKLLSKKQRDKSEMYNIDGSHAVMQKIEPGSFKMGETGDKVDVTLTKPFEMSATVMTQSIWYQIAEAANIEMGSRYSIPLNPVQDKGGSLPIFSGPLVPVYRINFNEVREWIDALNELSQLGHPLLAKLISGHKKGDVYRLPTEAEWEFVVRGRGHYNDKYYFGDDENQLVNHAWNDNIVHPVAQKDPLDIDGKRFYDMYGNTNEMVCDKYDKTLKGGIDPKGPATKTGQYDEHVIRGGKNSMRPQQMSSAYREPWYDIRDSMDGFRLVRNLREKP